MIQRRLLIVANRLPLTVTECDEDKVEYKPSAGGLATGLSSLLVESKHWIGWPGIHPKNDKEEANIQKTLEADNIHPVFLTKNAMENYYKGFSNETVWPLFHYFTNKAAYNKEFWEVYQQVNQQFCDEVMKVAHPNDTIWVHDYHLLLLPQLLREKLPDAEIGFFLHIPFPSYEIFRTLPWRKEILTGILGADLVGFHTSNYMRHFLSAAYRVLGVESQLGMISMGTRQVQVEAHPMGIDYNKFHNASQDMIVQENINHFKEQFGNKKLMLSVDRLDYSKGIVQRLKAFDLLLMQHPEFRGQVSLVVIVVPSSRDQIGDYYELKVEIDRMVGEINGKYSLIDWMPINYFYRSFQFDQLCAIYNIADVALITPFRDGMNLVAKEFVASKANLQGVLILSEMAGSADELRQGLMVNPNDIDSIEQAMEQALIMSGEEQASRLSEMQQHLQLHTVQYWANKFIKELADVHSQQLERKQKEFTSDNCKQLLSDFASSKRRLILLDYDGTLVPFVGQPEKAVPDQQLISLLERLTGMENTKVVITSGRHHLTLEKWFGKLTHVELIAEHGSWMREDGEWQQTIEPDLSWKREIYPILKGFSERTNGSFVEEKPFSLAWHYRKADAWIADMRAQGLLKALVNPCTENNLTILDGNKVVEVKVSGMDKGTGAKHWLKKDEWDFVLALGDDITDEDMFNALPETAYSIKVGYDDTAARFNVGSHVEVRDILEQMAAGEN